MKLLASASASAAALGFVAAAASPALADRRSFTRTYEYLTMPEGETEVELYSTQARPDLDGDVRTFQLQVEVEHGLTRRWDVSLYHVFDQSSGDATTPASPLALSEIKLRTRYRFAERGQWPVDVLAYGELSRAFAAEAYAAEFKAILARDFGKATVAVNFIGEFGTNFSDDAAEDELEVGWAAGATYEATPSIKVGAESWGGTELGDDGELAASAGPAVSWAPSTGIWLAATVGLGLTDAADDLSMRAILSLAVD